MRLMTLALVLVGCGKTSGGGLQVDVDYFLLAPTGGCVRVSAVPDTGTALSVDVPLAGKPRSAQLNVGVNRAPAWPAGVTIIGTLHETTCDAIALVTRSANTTFPSGAVEHVPLSLMQPVGGGAGGGGGGGGGAGGGTAGGGSAGGAAGGSAGGAAGGTAGGAGGGTAGGAPGGGAPGGGAGGGVVGTCDGGFVTKSSMITANLVAVSVYGPESVWIGGPVALSGPHLAQRTPATAGSFVGVPMSACTSDIESLWARPTDGRVYLGMDRTVAMIDSPSGMCTQVFAPRGQIDGIVGFGAAGTTEIFAASDTGDGVHWVESTGALTEMPIATALHAIDAAARTHVFAVGEASAGSSKGVIVRYDGSNWGTERVLGSGTVLRAISMVDANVGYAGGDGNSMPRWNGVDWNGTIPRPGFGTVRGLKALGLDDVYAVGDTGRVEHWDGTMWSVVADFPGVSNLYGIGGTSRCNLWVTGENGLTATTDH